MAVAIPADLESLEKVHGSQHRYYFSPWVYPWIILFLEYYYSCAKDAELGAKIHFVLGAIQI